MNPSHQKYGELGDGTKIQRESPVLVDSIFNSDIIKIAAGRQHSIMLNSKGYVYLFGRGVIHLNIYLSFMEI
jgi:alpha-tubulin suppressor-like RCC1 family protein